MIKSTLNLKENNLLDFRKSKKASSMINSKLTEKDKKEQSI